MKDIFKKLWPELALHKGKLIMVLLLGAVVSGTKGWIPELFKHLEGAWQSGDRTLAMQIPFVIAGLWVISGIARYFHLFGMKYIADLISLRQRRDLMNKYLSLNIGFFQDFEKGSGGLISRMLNDVIIIQQGIHRFADVLREPIMALFMLGYLIYIDWKITFFVVVAAPFVMVVLTRFAKSLRKYGHRSQEVMEDLTKTLKETLDGTRVVQSFQLEEQMRDRFNTQADEFLSHRKKIISREEAAGPISESLTSFAISFLLIYIGNQIFDGQFTMGDLLSFMVAVTFLTDSIKKLQNGYIKLQQASVAMDRLHQILDQTNEVTNIDTPKDFPYDWQKIQFENLNFAYNDNTVLKNVNLTVNRGEVIAIVGESGSGKSTLVNLLERFFDPTQGQVTIGGTNIKDLKLEDLRKNVALVTQDVFLFSDTIEKNIHFGDLTKDPAGIEAAAKMANAHNFISSFPEKYQTNVGDHGGSISGGEKQRISIARAIFKDAPILILDEATSALDSASEQEVQKGLSELMKGRTTFVIAHRLSTIAKADRILVFQKGELIEEGSHNELLAKQGEYFKFHQMQSGI